MHKTKKRISMLLLVIMFISLHVNNVKASGHLEIPPEEERIETKILQPIPSKDFDPLTATNEELTYYNFPTRPIEEEKLERWKELMEKPKKIVNKKIKSPTKKGTDLTNIWLYGNNWSGFAMAYAENDWSSYNAVNGDYNKVSGEWIVPSVSGSRTDTYSSTWVGIGGMDHFDKINDKMPLIQAGTHQGVDQYGKVNYYLWYEILGTSVSFEEQRINALDVKPGDRVYVDVSFTWDSENSNVGTARFYFHNISTGIVYSFGYTGIYQWWGVNTSSEWITEAPSRSEAIQDLSKFSQINWYNIQSGTVDDTTHPNMANPRFTYTDLEGRAKAGTVSWDYTFNEGKVTSGGNFVQTWTNY